MSKFIVIEPTAAVFEGSQEELGNIKAFLTETNTSVSYLISKHTKNRWFKQKDPVGWAARLDDLRGQAKKTHVFHKNGLDYVRPGSLTYLKEAGFTFEVENHVDYPKPDFIAWKNKPRFEPYPYQAESVKKLIEAKHGAVDICTGGGKTFIAALLTKHYGLRTLVMVPSKAIFKGILEEFELLFGKTKVGQFGDGKKDISKQITIAISKSVSMVEEDTPEWDFLSKKQVIVLDEAHTTPSKTLEDTVHGVLKNAPYRFAMSGTPTRGDGQYKLLQSILGPIVHTLSTKDAIVNGYVCPIETRIITIDTPSSFWSDDVAKMKRKHFLYNPNVLKRAADIANALWETKKEQTLILVEEMEQISILSKKLKVPFTYAHGNTMSKEESEIYGLEKRDVKKEIEAFNQNKFAVLIGSPSVEIGVNIFCHNCINLQAGASEIGVKQGAIGRMVRKLETSKFASLKPEKKVAKIFDFNVIGVSVLEKHLEKRIECYEETGCPVIRI